METPERNAPMRVARIITAEHKTVYAIEHDGRLVRAEGDLFQGTLKPTDDTVEPNAWLCPIEPKVLMCIGRNYAAHAAEGGSPPPDYPILFMKNLGAATGHMQPVTIPTICEDEVDYEGELAVVIGKAAKNVSKADALNYVLGYSAANDISARIWQAEKGGSQWCRGKGFDTFAPIGPVLVTADEIPDPQTLDIATVLNGQEVQHSNTKDMIFDVATLISFLSEGTTLQPGTVILTGTPEGVGWARSPKLTLNHGDHVTVTIANIGTLENHIERK
jgi:2-keto-4-pentenoate hydratase/2-oxohepta-3-ene-1,7-dioic acid hydratase in catechol pathway